MPVKKNTLLIIVAALLIVLLVILSPIGLGRLLGNGLNGWLDQKPPQVSGFPPERHINKISVAYESFEREMVDHFELILADYEYNVNDKMRGVDITFNLNIMERDINDLPNQPVSRNPKLQPLYDVVNDMKSDLLLSIEYLRSRGDEELTDADVQTLVSYYDGIKAKESGLRDLTFQIFNENNVQYFIENDGTITFYD